MDAAAVLAQEEDDLEDFDLSQGMSEDLVDYEDMSPLPSPAKPDLGVPTASTARASAAPIDDDRDLIALEAEIDVAAAAAADADAAAPERAGKRARSPPPSPWTPTNTNTTRAEAPALDDAVPPRAPVDAPDDTLADDTLADVEMRDQHTYVPLESAEVVLVERICRRVREPKKHLVRLLVKQFGSALAEGALRETERVEREGGSFFEADGKPPRRRSRGNVHRRRQVPRAGRRISSASSVGAPRSISSSGNREKRATESAGRGRRDAGSASRRA